MSVLGSYPLIIVGCLIILLSFIFTKIANRTNVPAVLMLIGLGVLIQYGLKLMKVPDIDFFSNTRGHRDYRVDYDCIGSSLRIRIEKG